MSLDPTRSLSKPGAGVEAPDGLQDVPLTLSSARRILHALALSALLTGPGAAASQQAQVARDAFVSIEGTRHQWQFLSLTFATAVDTDEILHPVGHNPFLDYRLRVTFTHASSGARTVVQGFYAADGLAADTGASAGNRWRVRFTPDRAGNWIWQAEFRHALGIALDPSQKGRQADARVDGSFGSFLVAPTDPSAPGFLSQGALRYVDGPYFRFAETQDFYLKSGAGGPENFLGYFEFDGTTGDPLNPCLVPPQRLHRYAQHAGDYTGDAVDAAHTWGPDGHGKNILGAINYMASRGVNSLYFVTDTYLGDSSDTWPWVAPTDKLHFDVSKLDQWERVFSHMSHRGIQLQVVLEESENDQLSLAAGGLGLGLTPERKLYYREIVARFAHHQAVIWVIGDESNYFDEVPAMESLASEIRSLDPYRHPISFHSKHPCFGQGCPEPFPSITTQYAPYFDFEAFEATTYQNSPGAYNNSTIQLRQAQQATRKWAHYGDEQSLNAIPDNLDENRTKVIWGNLMGGGAGVAWYPGNNATSQYPGNLNICDYYDITAEDMRVFEGYFVQTKIAIDLFQTQLPFTEMEANNGIASNVGPQDYVFYRPGGLAPAVYAVYRATGTGTDLLIEGGMHTVEWFNPRTGEGPLPDTTLEGPGWQPLTPPSQGAGIDWLAIVRQS